MQNPVFLGKTHRVYRYRLSCTGTGRQWITCTGTAQTYTSTDWQWITCTGTTQTYTDTDWQWITCTGTSQSGTGTGCSSSPVLKCFRTVKSRIRISMSRDPKK